MTPFLFVVIYCRYRVQIPSLQVASFRNVQLLLSLVGAALVVQAFATGNPTENFICPHKYTARLGRTPLAVVKTLDVQSNLEVSRNSFWLLGVKDDFYTIQQIKRTACNEDIIPIIVFFMHPSQDLAMDAAAVHYMPHQRTDSWEEYDELIASYSSHLRDVPSLIVMEPSLLMHTFNSKSEYHNTDYQLAFSQRVQKVVDMFPRSWVYVDAGNVIYLQWKVNLDHIIEVMKNMPPAIRGFSINVGSFVNTSFNEQIAAEIHCHTGLHFIIDTSRNGGDFSSRSLEQINECTYDPPGVTNGTFPSFMPGALNEKLTAQSVPDDSPDDEPEEITDEEVPARRRRKRWELGAETNQGQGQGPVYEVPSENGVIYDPAAYGYHTYDLYTYDSYGSRSMCVSPDDIGLDAYAWIKTPGESDGRMFPAGTYHPCLLNHFNECNDTCPQFVPKIGGDFQRPDQCACASYSFQPTKMSSVEQGTTDILTKFSESFKSLSTYRTSQPTKTIRVEQGTTDTLTKFSESCKILSTYRAIVFMVIIFCLCLSFAAMSHQLVFDLFKRFFVLPSKEVPLFITLIYMCFRRIP